jgi:hypothetical protein
LLDPDAGEVARRPRAAVKLYVHEVNGWVQTASAIVEKRSPPGHRMVARIG